MIPRRAPPRTLDVTDANAVESYIKERQPDVVVHLAAIAAVTAANRDPRLAWRVNLDGTLNLVFALQRHAPAARLMLISSAEVYGRSLNTGTPVDETAVLEPVNAYAASKAAADILVRQAGAAGLFTTVMRAFNHTGPGQSEDFVAPSFAAQIARIEARLQPPVLAVGDLDEERDFLDVDDVTDAYAAVLDAREGLRSGEAFNVASGRSVRIGDILEQLLSLATVPITIRHDRTRRRITSIRKIVGNASRLRRAVNWSPQRPFGETLIRLLEYERQRFPTG